MFRFALAVPLLVATGCTVLDVAPLAGGVYESDEEQIWLHIDIEGDAIAFYDAEDAALDDDGGVNGVPLYDDSLEVTLQEDRGEACGDGLAYEALILDAMVAFELKGTFFSWPTLVQTCGGGSLILIDDPAAMACTEDVTCFVFDALD